MAGVCGDMQSREIAQAPFCRVRIPNRCYLPAHDVDVVMLDCQTERRESTRRSSAGFTGHLGFGVDFRSMIQEDGYSFDAAQDHGQCQRSATEIAHAVLKSRTVDFGAIARQVLQDWEVVLADGRVDHGR